MQPHLRDEFPDPPADLHEAKTHTVELHPTRSAGDQLPPQGLHWPVGHGVQEQPELVGDEAVATEAICLQVELEILYPILSLSSASVELAEGLRLVISRSAARGTSSNSIGTRTESCVGL